MKWDDEGIGPGPIVLCSHGSPLRRNTSSSHFVENRRSKGREPLCLCGTQPAREGRKDSTKRGDEVGRRRNGVLWSHGPIVPWSHCPMVLWSYLWSHSCALLHHSGTYATQHMKKALLIDDARVVRTLIAQI